MKKTIQIIISLLFLFSILNPIPNITVEANVREKDSYPFQVTNNIFDFHHNELNHFTISEKPPKDKLTGHIETNSEITNYSLDPQIIAQTQSDVKGFDCNSVVDVLLTECEALVDLYESTNGAGWTNNDGWLSSTSVNNWYGIEVSNNFIISIDLHYNKLSGILPASLGQLSRLQTLELWNNQLTGTNLEILSQLISIKYLDLSACKLSGEIHDSIGQLTNLDYLSLSQNQLSGSIPESISQLSNLKKLRLVNNQLAGVLPDSLGLLTGLEWLDLGGNLFTGSFLESILQLSNLQLLGLDRNQFTGSIPESIGLLQNLKYL